MLVLARSDPWQAGPVAVGEVPSDALVPAGGSGPSGPSGPGGPSPAAMASSLLGLGGLVPQLEKVRVTENVGF